MPAATKMFVAQVTAPALSPVVPSGAGFCFVSSAQIVSLFALPIAW
eukprot:gene23222-30444_t